LIKESGGTWRETVIASETGRAFTFAVVFVAGGIVLTLECWKETVETALISHDTGDTDHGGHPSGRSSYSWKGEVLRFGDCRTIAVKFGDANVVMLTSRIATAASNRCLRLIATVCVRRHDEEGLYYVFPAESA
jgi:hypothetical protein